MPAETSLPTIDWTALRKELLLDDGKLELPANWKLPILPKTVTLFLKQANRPDENLRKLSQILEVDSHLTCELLKHVNSSAVGLRHKATNVHQALVTLGLRRSKMVLLTAAIQSSIQKFNSRLFDLHQFWADNLERGLFAREIAGEIQADLDLAFTGAMLQDFLLPVLSQWNLQRYIAYWQAREGIPSDLTDFEMKQFGVHHAQVAAACLLQWNVPDELICSVLCHHMRYEQLRQLGLLGSHVHAVAASSLLPVTIPQYRDVGVRVAEWDQADESFDLCDIAERVDAHYLHHETHGSDREPLVQRLERCLVSQFSMSCQGETLINRQIGNFILESRIGEGAMGTVYRARHTLLERPVAVKVLNGNKLTSLDIARFEREVRLSTRLTHPNTISIYDYGRTHDGLFYYVMEYVEGLTLKQLVQQIGPLPECRVIHILRQVCQSLQEAHALGIIHRDIKPENIIVSVRRGEGDFVTVLDFGLVAEDTNSGGAAADACISGTPLYMTPESIDQPEISNPSCDLYALGAVGYYLLCGQPLFTGNDALDICLKQVSELPIAPSIKLKHPLAEDLECLIMSCLQKSPQKRPASVAQLATALEGCRAAGEWSGNSALNWWEQHATQPKATEVLPGEATVIVGCESTM